MSLVQSAKTCFAKYATFYGESSRSEFWWYTLIYFVVYATISGFAQYITQISVAYQLAGLSGNTSALVAGINLSIYSSIIWAVTGVVWTILFIPFLAAGTRRLHNINMSGKWQLLQLTGIGNIWLIIWWSLKVPPTFTFRQSVASCWSKYFRFSGTSTRSEFWWFALFTVLALQILAYLYLIVSVFLYTLAMNGSPILSTLYTIWQIVSLAITCLLIIPLLAAGSRRLHDTNRTGWLQALLITVVGVIVLAILWSRETNLIRRSSHYLEDNNSLDWEPVCSLCGSAITANAAFCTSCGASQMPEPEVQQTEDIPTPSLVCPNCNAVIAPESKFCPNCGSPIN